jgi:hypothetical protein
MLKLVDSDSKISVEEFRVPASDSKGHTTRQYFSCTPDLSAQVDELFQSRKYPYRTKGDILRHALYRHMRLLSSMDPDLAEGWDLVEMGLELMRGQETEREIQSIFASLDKTVRTHAANGEVSEAIRWVTRVYSTFLKQSEGYIRDRALAQIKQRYGQYLVRRKPLDLRNIEEE